MNADIVLLPGDGIGPEVVDAGVRVLTRIGEVYGIGRDEAERQLRNWERNLGFDEFDEADLVLDDDQDLSGMNGRG